MDNTAREVDEYGNNINFPDEILSDITIKGLLGKWCDQIFFNMFGGKS